MNARPLLVRARLALLPLLLGACAEAPSYMRSDGIVAHKESVLGWVVTIIALAIMTLVGALLIAALWRSRRAADVARTGVRSGISWIVAGGIIMPFVIMTAVFVYTVIVLGAVAQPPRPPAFRIEIIGHRWWWEARYHLASAESTVVTANEIHIPANEPVRFDLESYDVIHSFWVPQLAGKTDVIPGQRNTMWLEASHPGTYRGQCTEYCGLQHANMSLYVIAQPRAAFERWLANQMQPAPPVTDSASAEGRSVFQREACAGCHAIRGTDALGRVGPDLTHLASRQTIGAGLLPNTRGNLAGWIANAQALKPGVGMPTMALSSQDLQVLVTYLEGLK